jgi:homopolymeric O-antigen transport system permease protein
MSQTTEAIRDAYRPRRPGIIQTLVETGREVASRRRLIVYLVRADLKKRGADTLLGNLWWILDPLLTMLVYVVLIAIIFQTKREAYPLFVFCAILPWKWFSSSIADAVTCITTRERIIKQVNFPKVVLPMAAAVGGVASFAFGLIPLLVMLVFIYGNHLSAWVLALPLIALVQFVFTLGVTLLAAAVTVFYRDVGNVATHVLRIWFYLSPALYGADQIASLTEKHPEIATIYNLNPFAALFESYRDIIYYGQAPEWGALALVLLESTVLLVVTVLLFRRLEPAFAKVI